MKSCAVISHSVLSNFLWPHGLYVDQQAPLSMGILQIRILEWVAISSSRRSSHPRDQTQVFTPCRQILYQLSHQGSPRILEWVVYPFSSGSSWPKNRTGVSWITGGFFTNWATREAPLIQGTYFLSTNLKEALWGWEPCWNFECLWDKQDKILQAKWCPHGKWTVKWKNGCEVIRADSEKLDSQLHLQTTFLKLFCVCNFNARTWIRHCVMIQKYSETSIFWSNWKLSFKKSLGSSPTSFTSWLCSFFNWR